MRHVTVRHCDVCILVCPYVCFRQVSTPNGCRHLCCLVVQDAIVLFLDGFPLKVAMSGQYILSTLLASTSKVTEQFQIKLFCRILLNSFSEGGSFWYMAWALSPSSILGRMCSFVLSYYGIEKHVVKVRDIMTFGPDL